MEEGTIYRDHDDGLVFRVREVRGTEPESVVAVEVLDEAVETYRTRREISEGLESGAIEPASDVDHEDFESEEPDVPLEEIDGNIVERLKYVAAGLVVVFVVAVAFPAGRVFAVLVLRVAVPLAVLGAAAYLGYRYLLGEDGGG